MGSEDDDHEWLRTAMTSGESDTAALVQGRGDLSEPSKCTDLRPARKVNEPMMSSCVHGRGEQFEKALISCSLLCEDL